MVLTRTHCLDMLAYGNMLAIVNDPDWPCSVTVVALPTVTVVCL